MNARLFIIVVAALLAGCATQRTHKHITIRGNIAALPPGEYKLTSLDAKGRKVAGPLKFTTPSSDPNVPIGTITAGYLCADDEAEKIVITDAQNQNIEPLTCEREQSK